MTNAHRLVAAIPSEMRDLHQWVVWRKLKRKGKFTKVPFRANLPDAEAASTDPSTWASFEDATAAYFDHSNKLDGIGFVFAEDGGLAGVDFDNCLDEGGKVLPWARPYLDRLVGYGDVSPSGRGIKIFTRGSVPNGKGRKLQKLGDDGQGAIEVYDRGRYFTVTGEPFDEAHRDLGDGAASLAKLHAEWFPAAVPRKAVFPTGPAILADDDLIRKAERAANGAKFSALMSGSIDGHPSKSEADLALCSILAFWTRGDVEAIDRIFRRSGLSDEKWTERPDYRERTIAKALERTEFYDPNRGRKGNGHLGQNGQHLSNDKPPEPPLAEVATAIPDRRPQIEINTQRHLAVAAAVIALGADPDLYSRAGSLVSVAMEKEDELRLTGKTRLRHAAGSPRIIELSDAIIGCRLTQHAKFYRWRTQRNGEESAVDAHPPDWLIRSVATRKHWDGIRPLSAVVECPFPRPNGSIVETAGYDPETATLYAPSIAFPKVPAQPTRDHAREAWKRISNHFPHFPFASEDDRVVVLAGILNIIARPAIDGPVPGIAVNGNKAGTGKGLLIDGMSMPAIGRPAPTSAYPEDKEEAAKVKVAIAMAARTVVHFDNLEEGSMYGNGALDSALTAPTVDDRVLGASKLVGELQLRASWFLSGNNINPCKDAYRRWLVINLVTELEHPERRNDLGEESFRSIIQAKRGEIVCDALTILRAHALAGRPGAGWGPLGSFEEWDRVVRRAVWYATDRDCLTTQQKTAEGSQDRQDKLALLQGWFELPGGKTGLATNTGVALVEANKETYPTLWGVMLRLGQAGKPMTSRALGNRFRGLQNNRIGGFMLKQAGEQHGTTLWAVESNHQENLDKTPPKTIP